MKRITLLTIATFFCMPVLFSQVQVGVDAGIAVSRGSYSPSVGLDRRVYGGFDGGVLFEIGLTRRIMIQPEINLSMIGVELNNGQKEATIKLRYITIPVLLKVNVSGNLNLFAGPQIGYLLQARRDSSFTNELIDMRYQFKNEDFGITFGVEYKFSRHFFLRAGGTYGICQIAENDEDFEMKNRYLSFRIGYIF
jgi:hypothetical protein